MSTQSYWYYTGLPDKVIDAIEEDLKLNLDPHLASSVVGHINLDTDKKNEESVTFINKRKRNALNAWVPAEHWITGFLWHYVMMANRQNFLYDIEHVDRNSLQYTVYNEGHFYGWHNDGGLPICYQPVSNGNQGSYDEQTQDFLSTTCEKVRKLSFSLLLSDPETYEGGNFQLIDENEKTYIAPRQKGSIILFDSRARHRVTPVRKGTRKSIVGWTIGPRWK